MSDQPEFPALSNDELREMLDLLATAVASISDRVDDQTSVLDRVNKSATETRTAAFAARKQTDPETYGKLVANTPIRQRISAVLAHDQSGRLILSTETSSFIASGRLSHTRSRRMPTARRTSSRRPPG